MMRSNLSLWIIAFILTSISAVFQRVTGPTYPVSGKVSINGRELFYRLERAHGGPTDHRVSIQTADSTIKGRLEWKKYRSAGPWISVPMIFSRGALFADLPTQPPSGKLVYHIFLDDGSRQVTVPPHGDIVIRFKGIVPPLILIVHIGLMFLGMFVSTRAGLEFFRTDSDLRRLCYWSIGLLAGGGLIFGPIVQRYAFGSYWTGWPVGPDLTDNKTAIIVLAWVAASIALKKSQNPKRWALAAAIITLLLYLVPHSVLGSELEYSPGHEQEQTRFTNTG